jgi:hypothetical protein
MAFAGLEERIGRQTKLQAKFDALARTRGPAPKNYVPHVNAVDKVGENITLEIDPRSATLMDRALRDYTKKLRETRFHLLGILLVDCWATFEAYVQSSLAGFYRDRPDALACNEQVTVKQMLDNRADVLQFLIDRQVDSIGHMTLSQLTDYLQRRLGFEFSTALIGRLEEYYLLRNVFAHAGGAVTASTTRAKIRKELLKQNGTIVRVGARYLTRMRHDVMRAITTLDAAIRKKSK